MKIMAISTGATYRIRNDITGIADSRRVPLLESSV